MTAAAKIAEAPERIWADQDNLTWVERDPSERMKQDEVEFVRADHLEAEIAKSDALAQENAKLRYVLAGVRGAIDTGRNEPLMIWREQISIALSPDTEVAQ